MSFDLNTIEQVNFDLEAVRHDVPMAPEERSAWLFHEIIPPSEWVTKRFVLPAKGYGDHGAFSFAGREWQADVMDAVLHNHFVIVCGPVQVGKSVAGIDVPWAWFQSVVGGRSLLIYADKSTVESVFEEKLKPIVEENLKHLWSGRDNDIRRDKIILRSGISRCGSCNVQNDIATFSAKFVGLDEVAKWKSRFDAVGQSIGRTRDYWGAPGIDYRVSIVSSPKDIGDTLYTQIYKPGVLVVRYYMPCPGCGFKQQLEVENIHEIPPEGGEKDHDPVRIRRDKAAQYVCPECGVIIDDNDRYEMIRNGRWEDEDHEYYVRKGRVYTKNDDLVDSDRVCFWFNRLISRPEKYPFWECLAAYFEAKYSHEANEWQNFWNEDLARFYKPRSGRITEGYLRGKQLDYTTADYVPDGVLAIVGGIDTQDNGFYYTQVGYGRYMETWILRFGFIPCDMNMSQFKDPENVANRFEEYYYKDSLRYKDGRVVACLMAMMDEGGHRKSHVQYICQKHRDIVPYKGVGKDAEMFRKSTTKHLYLCNTESFSKLVEKDMQSSTFHLPQNVTQDFIDQIQRQYTKEEVDTHGRPKYTWIHGGDDHYRDCLNQALCAAHILQLPALLNNEQGIKKVLNTVESKSHNVEKPKSTEDIPKRYQTTTRSPFTRRPRLWRAR